MKNKTKKCYVKHLTTKKRYEFICWSEEYFGQFIYRTQDGECEFDLGYPADFTPVGMTWYQLGIENAKR